MQTVIDRQALAERWDVTPQTIIEYEQKGIIHRLKKFPSPRYSMTEVMKIEDYTSSPVSIREVQLQRELEATNQELERLRTKHKELLSILL